MQSHKFSHIFLSLFVILAGRVDPAFSAPRVDARQNTSVTERPEKVDAGVPLQSEALVYLETNILNLELADAKSDRAANFAPNSRPGLGLGGAYQGFRLRWSWYLPPEEESIRRRGNTDQFDFMIGKSWGRHTVDFVYQDYRGFYLEDDRKSDDEKSVFDQRPNVRLRTRYLNYYYTLRPELLDLETLWSAETIGNRDGGSPVLLAAVNHSTINLGQPAESFLAMRSGVAGWSDTEWWSAMGGLGYGQMWVRSRHRTLLLGGLGAGPALHRTGPSPYSQETIAPTYKGNLSVAYRYILREFIFGSKLLGDIMMLPSDTVGIMTTSGALTAEFSYLF